MNILSIEKTPANNDDCKELDFVVVIHGPLFTLTV